MSQDTQSFAAGFFVLIGGSAILGLGAIAGIGIGGYYLGVAIGVIGTAAAVGSGVGIIIGGLAVLAGIGFGIYGVIDYCLNKRDATRRQQDLNSQYQPVSDTTKISGSTQQIVRSTSSQKLNSTPDTEKQVVAVCAEEHPQTTSNTVPVKQSSLSKLLGIFKKSSKPELQSHEVKDPTPSL